MAPVPTVPTESGLTLPMGRQAGTETDSKHSMPTVLSSASGGCHATHCPTQGQRKGEEEFGKERGEEGISQNKPKTINEIKKIKNRLSVIFLG